MASCRIRNAFCFLEIRNELTDILPFGLALLRSRFAHEVLPETQVRRVRFLVDTAAEDVSRSLANYLPLR